MNGGLEHLVAYLITGLAFVLGYAQRDLKIALGLLIYGGILEIGQLIVPGRHAGFLDFAWSAAGVLCALAVAQIVRDRFSWA